ncbi:tRNA modification GTPase TrmE [Spiroplasma sabaudiense Ar-1343]|uniref:tRNA modification GTPase MnmE n=1 Tax=Spiroplasma sabaudiense Ar-1343 TaxID=1276257 RepID=W6AB99_9MOLU|nr:tRNA uridine-5-carboxymethylaminomethyl(34) synthesis GTPase MnmE [Spiroplasma sabaudiense]AHI54332.1 tRNA modification GTPase TrmE [Spiroplasma sabaudiense Ar-1343]
MIIDTIVAPATNIAQQALAIIRVSGIDAFNIINQLLKKPLKKQRSVNFCDIIYQDRLLDQVVITTFIAPKSFTGEDTIEINCHGGVLVTKQILEAIINAGARMALPGEFSQRAFLNNKINLLQAEAINDLITAKNLFASQLAVRNMSKKNNIGVKNIKVKLLDIISRIQTSIDYPEYDDIDGSSNEELLNSIDELSKIIKTIIFKSRLANQSVSGIQTALVGSTNVGKSSILNCLLNEDKAIVSSEAGTTRDLVEGEISFANFTLKLIDTAGIRSTENKIESIGIQKSYQVLKEADLVIFVLDAQSLKFQDEFLTELKDKTVITVVNKSEILTNQEKQVILKKNPEIVFCSAINNEIDELINKIKDKYDHGEVIKSDDLVLSNIYHISLLSKVENKIEIAYNNFKSGYPVDIINVDLYEAWDNLNVLLGESYDEEIIDNIFRKYCLGK